MCQLQTNLIIYIYIYIYLIINKYYVCDNFKKYKRPGNAECTMFGNMLVFHSQFDTNPLFMFIHFIDIFISLASNLYRTSDLSSSNSGLGSFEDTIKFSYFSDKCSLHKHRSSVLESSSAD